MSKYFIITVDTEGDNLWDYHNGEIITTHNTHFIPRFQELCNKYSFPPVYLTNYEMINDKDYVNYMKGIVNANQCEIGIHVHAWNNPPYYDLGVGITDNSYLIEYPYDIMRKKFATTYNLIYDKIGLRPVSHRAGRWAMNDYYFKILNEFNILVDCSHTPHIDWSSSKGANIGGPDYRNINSKPSFIGEVLEVPVSVLPTKEKVDMGIKSLLYHLLKRKTIPYKTIWLRPAQSSLNDMKRLVKKFNNDENVNYLEFMIHSSELMPNGSPYFPTEKSIEKMYADMECLFEHVSKLGYIGCTLKEYRNFCSAEDCNHE